MEAGAVLVVASVGLGIAMDHHVSSGAGGWYDKIMSLFR